MFYINARAKVPFYSTNLGVAVQTFTNCTNGHFVRASVMQIYFG